MKTILTKTLKSGKNVEVWMRGKELIVGVDGQDRTDSILPFATPAEKNGTTYVAIAKNAKVGFTADEYRVIVNATAGVSARFAGTCAKSGRRYGKGARIEHTQFGWTLVGATLDLDYNMGREDSPL